MTCIVGIEHLRGVLIGGDSAGTDGSLSQRVRADAKVFVRGEFVFGFCGSFRMGQLLRYRLEVPQIEKDDLDEYMATSFIDSVRDTSRTGAS